MPEGRPDGQLDASLAAELERKLSQADFDLPVLPEAASGILTETSRADWSVETLVALLKRDAAMAAHLLRLANSAAFRPASPIVSLHQAVSRLGALQLKQLALLIACETRVFRVPGFEAEMRGIFRHCLAVALYAQEIARARRSNVEEAFLAGILHDVGWPILVQALIDLHQRFELPPDRGAVLAAAERSHEQLGQALATRWSLPDRVAQALAVHHQQTGQLPELASVVALADVLARRAAGEGEVSAESILAHPAVLALNLYPEVVDALLARGKDLWDLSKLS
jgi:putative nucleotidyltransferase with HDIG domain